MRAKVSVDDLCLHIGHRQVRRLLIMRMGMARAWKEERGGRDSRRRLPYVQMALGTGRAMPLLAVREREAVNK